MSKLLLFLFLLFGLFLPRFRSIDIEIFIGLLIVLYYFLKQKGFQNIKLVKEISMINIPFLLLIVISGISAIVNNEYYGIGKVLRILVTINIYILVMNIYKIKDILRYSLIIIIINIIVMANEFVFSSSVRPFLLNINLFFDPNFNLLFDITYRARGLFLGYDSAGIFLGFSATLLMYLSIKYWKKPKLSILILSLIAIGLTISSSRTGLLVSFLGQLALVPYWIKNLNKRILSIFIKFIPILCIAIVIFSNVNFTNEEEQNINNAFDHAFELFSNYKKNQSISTVSTDDLIQNHYFINLHGIEVLIGQNKGIFGQDGIPSDVGYVQALHQFGVIGFILFHMPFLIFLYFRFKELRFQNISNTNYALLMYISLTILIINLKGSYIYTKSIFLLIMIFAYVLVDIDKKINSGKFT